MKLSNLNFNFQFQFSKNIIPYDQFGEYRNKTLNPTFKGVVLDFHMQVLVINEENYKRFTYKRCLEHILLIQSVFYMRKNFFLQDQINDKMERFKSNGLIDYFMRKNYNSRYKIATTTDPTSITIHQLRGIFEMLVYGLGLSSIVLLIEVIKHRQCD